MLLMTVLNFGSTVYAEDSDEQLLSKGMWRDPVTGLVWTRCSLGQEWDGVGCNGYPLTYKWEDAMLVADKHQFSGYTDWYLPTVEDITTLLKCRFGFIQGKDNWYKMPTNDGLEAPKKDCKNYPGGGLGMPTRYEIDSKIFPDPYPKEESRRYYLSNNRWEFDVNGGNVYDAKENKDTEHFIRLVRKPSSLGYQVFEGNVAIIKQKQAELVRQEEEAQKDAVQAHIRAEAEEKERQARLKREAALPAQSMYLQAGKYDRNGQQSDAKRLYELLIEKYPNHALAVQANNRLVGIKSGNDAASTASSRANAERSRASESCKKRKSSYIDSCSPLDGDAKYACWDRANALCSE